MIPKQQLEQAMRVKASMVHDLAGRVDLSPIVVHHSRGVHVATVHACGPPEGDGMTLPLVSTRLACAGFETDELMLTADAHVRFNADERSSAETAPGQLAHEFANDPMTDVTEALVSVYVQRGCFTASSMSVPYHYTDHDGVLAVEFDAITEPSDATGPGTESLVASVNLADDDVARDLRWAVSVAAEATHHSFAQMLVAMFDHGVMVFS
jgi:hypothetical protein